MLGEQLVKKVQMSEAEGRDLLESPDADATALLEVARLLEDENEAFEFLDHRGNVLLARDTYEEGLRGFLVENPRMRMCFEGHKLEHEADLFERAAERAERWAAEAGEEASVADSYRERCAASWVQKEQLRQARQFSAQAAESREKCAALVAGLDRLSAGGLVS